MKIKLDENIPATLTTRLAELGHDADSVPDENLTGQPDTAIWASALAENRFLVTQDLDFSDASQMPPGSHPGILLLRLPAPSRKALFERIEALFATEPIEQWPGCLVIATERKIRIRRPSQDS